MEEDEIDIRGLFGILRRRIKLIFAVVVLVMAGAFFYVSSLTPYYTASTLILVDPGEKNLLSPEYSGDAYANFSINDVRVNGEIEILKSVAVAMRVVEEAGLLTDPEFGYPPSTTIDPDAIPRDSQFLLQAVIQGFRGSTNVSRQSETYLIVAQVSSIDPIRAAELTNIYANAYIKHQIATKVESIQKVSDILRARLEDARVALQSSEASFDQFIGENMSLIEEQTDRADLSALQALYSSVNSQSIQRGLTLDTLEASLQSEDWNSIADALQDDAIRLLDAQRQALETSLEAAGSGTQLAIDIRQELTSIDATLNKRTTTALNGLRSEIVGLNTQASKTQSKIRDSVLQGDLPPELLTKIYALQQDASITRSQYDNFLFRLREIELQSDLQVADSRVISPALPPIGASSQSKRQILMLAGVLALGLGVGLAFLNEFIIGGFTSEEQLANSLQLPVAVRIPAVAAIRPRRQHSAEPSVAQVYIEHPMSEYAESIRRLRVSLDQSLRKRRGGLRTNATQGEVIVIASTVPAEGKSNTSIALGRTYASSGLRTLLIDCDLRKPRIHRILGTEPDSGMLQYLVNDVEGDELADDFKEMYHHDRESGLEVLLGSGHSNVPTDQLLAGPRFTRLIQNSREVFDVIILDTPPLQPLVDGLYISHHADVIALVVKWASTTQRDVKSILSGLFEAKDENTEVLSILCQEKHNNLRRYRKYSEYYTYSDEE
ncbi:MAG: hypothetical protein KAS85_05240 [Rhodobacteraceae bacterium]|nr:hypothetical protein [Paracoccaceae bacterium]